MLTSSVLRQRFIGAFKWSFSLDKIVFIDYSSFRKLFNVSYYYTAIYIYMDTYVQFLLPLSLKIERMYMASSNYDGGKYEVFEIRSKGEFAKF